MEFKQENDDKQVKLDQALAEIDTLQDKLDLSEKREEGLQSQIRGLFTDFFSIPLFRQFVSFFYFFVPFFCSFVVSIFCFLDVLTSGTDLQMSTTEEKNELLREHEGEVFIKIVIRVDICWSLSFVL